MENKLKLSLTEWLSSIGHDYSLMHSAGIFGGATIALDLVDCKYYDAPEKEITGDRLLELLNYLRWDFDQFENVYKEVEKEVEVKTKSGNTTIKKEVEKVQVGIENKFPATPENILKKRKELLAEAIDSAKDGNIDKNKVLARAIPRLADHEKIVAATAHKRVSDVDQLANRLRNSV